jgi:uncharacterized phage protein (TIGR02220 family)
VSSDRPDPLVPIEVDLRDFPFIPLEFRRLFASETWILGSNEARCASVCLWCESWHQSPAASLPDNDKILAHLSQSGGRWGKVREHAMRGWVLCSDGRWYHPVVAEKALEAWAKHKKASSKGKAGAAKRWGTGIGSANATANSTGINQLMPADSNRTDMGNGREGKTLSGKPDLKPQAVEILNFLNAKAEKNFLPVPANIEMIVARLREGYPFDDIRSVIARKCGEWKADEKMAEYLRPKTLFSRTNFANYHGQLAQVSHEK